MEQRLQPINALIGLLTRNDVNPAVLATAGCVLAGLEVPVTSERGKVVVDAVIIHNDSAHLLLCEAKSGANIDTRQARSYAAVDPGAVIQAGHVSLPRRIAPTVEVLYVCLGEHVERVRSGLRASEVPCPLLAVHQGQITFENPELASEWLRDTLGSEPIELSGPPVRFISFDHESPLDAILPTVRSELIAALANRTPQLTMSGLAERVEPYLGLYGRGARSTLVRQVTGAARMIATEDPSTFAIDPPTANKDGLVRFLRTPEDNDPRGRTQGYQALARRSHTRTRRASRTDPDQLDLLDELEQAGELTDEDDGQNDNEEEMS